MHYRIPVFRRLHELYGWRVACAQSSFRKYADDEGDLADFIEPFDFKLQIPMKTIQPIPLGEILQRMKPKAVIAEFSLRMTSSYGLAFRRQCLGAPLTFFWSHGYNMDRGLSSAGQRAIQSPRVFLSKMVDGHLCYSKEGYDFLARYMDESKLFIAQNTIDIEPVREVARRVGRIDQPGGPHLLTIGRILRDKNFPMLVRVFRRFRDSFPDATLTIVGDGVDAERTRRAAGDELGRSIRMIGEEYDEDRLARLFCASDLVVFSGAVGLSVNHALAYGVPVMAFERTAAGPGHHPEIEYVQDFITGYRVPEYSEDALLEGLRMFFTRYPDPIREFGESIPGYVDGHILLDHMIGGFARINDALVERGITSDAQGDHRVIHPHAADSETLDA